MPHLRSASRDVASFKFPDGPTVRTSMDRFPDLSIDTFDGPTSYTSSPIATNGHTIGGPPPVDRWIPRRDGPPRTNGGHGRQKSLSDAFRNIRGRRASVSTNVHEVADALKAPVDPMLIILCLVWYTSSTLTNTSSKSILNAFPYPATLTLVQFASVSSLCVLVGKLPQVISPLRNVQLLRQGIRNPTREIIMTTYPLALFSIGGHLLSSSATAKIPVSLVHTIKGLSPLLTVFTYRVFYDIRYPVATYLSLIPLTLGVGLACSTEFAGHVGGILIAFLATIIFVTQNVFSKRLFNEASIAESTGTSRKIDKLNLLFYCSAIACLLTVPYWFWAEGITLLRDFFHDGSLDLNKHPEAFDHGRLAVEFVFNGVFHFGQSFVAFILLARVSPVTYSVASLFKRVFIVVGSLIWFQNPTTNIQYLGIALTFFGLYLFDRTKESNKADQKAKLMNIKEETVLPTSTVTNGLYSESPVSNGSGYMNGSSYANSPVVSDDKKSDGLRPGRSSMSAAPQWLPPGTKQEDTWRQHAVREEGLAASVS